MYKKNKSEKTREEKTRKERFLFHLLNSLCSHPKANSKSRSSSSGRALFLLRPSFCNPFLLEIIFSFLLYKSTKLYLSPHVDVDSLTCSHCSFFFSSLFFLCLSINKTHIQSTFHSGGEKPRQKSFTFIFHSLPKTFLLTLSSSQKIGGQKKDREKENWNQDVFYNLAFTLKSFWRLPFDSEIALIDSCCYWGGIGSDYSLYTLVLNAGKMRMRIVRKKEDLKCTLWRVRTGLINSASLPLTNKTSQYSPPIFSFSLSFF